MRRLPLPLRLMLLALTLPAVPGCVRSPPISAPPPACSSLIPDDWRTGVHHAPPPAEEPNNDAVRLMKTWTAFGLAEAGRLEIANARLRDTIGIIARCEARDAAAVKKSR